MPRRFPLVIVLLFLLLVLVIPLPSAHAAPSISSTSRVAGGSSLCGGSNPACSFSLGQPSISQQDNSFTLQFAGVDSDSSAASDDPWNSANVPSPGTNSGNSQYRFVIQEDSGRSPFVVVGAADSVTWSYSSSTNQITLTGTTMRAHFTAGIEYTGFAFNVEDKVFSADIGGANLDDFTGITVETNAETFTFGIISPTVWTLQVTGRTGTTGFWRAFIPQSVLTAIGASASDISLSKDGTSVGISPTLTTGKVTIGGADRPGYMLSLNSISYSTHTFETNMAPAVSAKPVETVDMGESVASASFAGTIAGAWGSSVDAVKQRINEGVAVANQMYPSTVGQPVGVLASGGNIMPGHGGYLQVIFGGTANMIVLLGYGADGRVTAMQQHFVRARGSGNSEGAAPGGSTPPESQTSGNDTSGPSRKPAMLMIQYSMQTGVTTIPVYPVKSDSPTTSAAAPLFVPQPATLSTQSSPLPAPTIAIVVLICLVVLSYFYSETAGKRAKPPSE